MSQHTEFWLGGQKKGPLGLTWGSAPVVRKRNGVRQSERWRSWIVAEGRVDVDFFAGDLVVNMRTSRVKQKGGGILCAERNRERRES